MKTIIGGFRGAWPKVGERLLTENHARSALNCEFQDGYLRASRSSMAGANVFTTTTRKSIYFYNKNPTTGAGFWFQRDTDVNWVRGQIANDNQLRTYFTGDGVPKMTFVDIAQGGSPGDPYPLGSRTLGVPAPSGFFIATGPSTEIIIDDSGPEPVEIDPTDGAQVVSTSYVMTYVTDLGEEGPPSAPSSIVERYDGGAVELSSLPVPTGGT